MHTVILTIGSRGDVQPYMALGRALLAAGHRVTLATNTNFAAAVAEQGLNYAPLQADFLEMIQSEAGRKALAGKGRLKLMRQVMPTLRQILEDCWAAAHTADLLISHPKAMGGYHIAEKLGVPGFMSLLTPLLTPTAAFANPLLPREQLGPRLNRLSYTLFNRLSLLPYHGLLNRWRRETLGLPPRPRFSDESLREGRPVPVLYGYSEHVVPRPTDWGEHIHVTGYWFLDEPNDWQPPAALRAFLQAGPPPVYVGFGSMVGRDPQALTDMVVAAVQRAWQRAILASGWGGLNPAQLPDSIFAVDAVPHSWLFPQVAAVVHHGGAGTTAAGLRAGKPTVICPFFGDQPFWGRRVAALGVGPQPLTQKRLTVDGLSAAIHSAATDGTMAGRAAELGMCIRNERSIEHAVAAVNKQFALA
ncbi:MAG: glycosyltransferase [Chloroflexaceae bacterium]|nr:glycosyltransferase [Chloroflexaceae bacterium]